MIGAKLALETWKRNRPLLSDNTKATYGTVWELWNRFLLSKGVSWSSATPAHVAAFIAGAGLSERSPRKPKVTTKLASYTQERYWRILDDIYAAAEAYGSAEHRNSQALPAERNPFKGQEKRKPTVPAKQRLYQALAPFVLEQLRDPEILRELLPLEAASHWTVSRNRALIALLADCGLTVGELRALTGSSLRRGAAQAHPRGTLSLPTVEPIALTVYVPEAEVDALKDRQLEVSAAAEQFLMAWLEERELVLQACAARVGLVDRRPWFPEAPLFISREGGKGERLPPPMDPSSIYVCVAKVLKVLDKSKAPKGPAVVRNAVILDWVAKRGRVNAAEWAGLESAANLRVVPHSTG